MRILLLTIGPVVIVGLNYWLTMPFGQEGLAAFFNRRSSSSTHAEPSVHPADLQTACEVKAHDLRPLLSADCRTIVRSPFVLGGDLREKELDRYYRQLILPITRALANSYFDRPPDEPITILMFSSDRSYRDHAMRIDGSRRSHYYGFYQRTDRRLILNISTGSGTLAHELTHALAHFDFPDMPEWFDEGLASLHEQSEFSDDETRLVGLNNWRLNYLLHAINRGGLRTIDSLMSSREVRVDRQAADYAHARYFCLYLQQRGMLSRFYRMYRDSVEDDPTGTATLRQMLEADTLDTFERDFRAWAINMKYEVRSTKYESPTAHFQQCPRISYFVLRSSYFIAAAADGGGVR